MKLPIDPFRAWMLERLHRRFHGNVGELAEFLGARERQVRRWLYEQRSIKLEQADAALCHAGDPWVLYELWPELSEDPVAA